MSKKSAPWHFSVMESMATGLVLIVVIVSAIAWLKYYNLDVFVPVSAMGSFPGITLPSSTALPHAPPTKPVKLSESDNGPPPLLQPTPPYEHTVDTETSKIQNSTAQLSTVFSV